MNAKKNEIWIRVKTMWNFKGITNLRYLFLQKKPVHPFTPGRLTWNLKITQLKRKIIFQPSFFRGYVSFQGGYLKNRDKLNSALQKKTAPVHSKTHEASHLQLQTFPGKTIGSWTTEAVCSMKLCQCRHETGIPTHITTYEEISTINPNINDFW